MIKHHPNQSVLKDFVTGELPDSISLIVSSHVEMCEHCQHQISLLTQDAADEVFGLELDADKSNVADNLALHEDSVLDQNLALNVDFDDLNLCIDSITADISLEDTQTVAANDSSGRSGSQRRVFSEPLQVQVADTEFTMPRALTSVARKDWLSLGKISRARLDFEDGSHHTSLLHIDKDGQVPCHTHKGFEITLLLEGSFEDEMGVYNKGDFIWLDGNHTHQPATKEGCVCLTVSSDALYFTKGVSQLFNPLGKYIY